MGSKKHKKHHKSEKKDASFDDRQEKPLKLVLKVGGSVQSPVHSSNSSSAPNPVPRVSPDVKPPVFEEPKMEKSTSHSHEKHKKSKKKKKKKSTDKDKERHDRKRKHQHHHHHHHHREHSHERKEKRRKELDSSRLLSEAHDSRDSLPIRAMEPHSVPIDKPVRDARTCTLKRKAQKCPLQILLYYLLKKLQLKDPQEFFAWPVTDVIAPGYSSIIANPIDFSTINKKIDDREYKSVSEFKSDVKLMCDNAMTYNRADTVYYKSARRLWHVAQKLMNRDQLMSLKRSFPYMLDLTVEELGFDINDESEESLPGTEIVADPSVTAQPEAKKSKVVPCWNTVELDDDDDEMSPEEILLQAQKAAKAAADRLTLKRPNSKFGFLRQNENGTTTLSIVHPKPGDRDVKVNLEMLTGKINQGTGSIVGFKEDSKNIIKPVQYTNYGPYSSYAPHFDSTFSNLSKEDSDLVLSTYGDELGLQYAESITTFAKDSDYVMKMVDNLLDSLTNGEHSKTVKLLEEKKILREEEAQARKALKPLNENEIGKNSPSSNSNGDIESFQTLEDIDLEISRLEHAGAENSLGDDENKRVESGEKSERILQKHKQLLIQRRAIQQKLDNATQLLQDLRKVQNERLSSNPPPHMALVRAPSNIEHDLADRVTKKLADVSSQLLPDNIVSVEGIRKAMGITYRSPNTTNLKNIKKSEANVRSNDADRLAGDVSVLRDETILDHHSPPDVSSDDRMNHQDLDTELREFLETGPILRVCDSPTGS
ncbi:bromodomain-containing protein 7-like [Uloborus diversus]|uniref:bromodomain-containing protein 7-like n=1 Tax=Uloborus diversus TaxID=327109 RepID=UPI002409CDB6|nr:bromodomain-containing protein 7-like [Uloborus diversus]